MKNELLMWLGLIFISFVIAKNASFYLNILTKIKIKDMNENVCNLLFFNRLVNLDDK